MDQSLDVDEELLVLDSLLLVEDEPDSDELVDSDAAEPPLDEPEPELDELDESDEELDELRESFL